MRLRVESVVFTDSNEGSLGLLRPSEVLPVEVREATRLGVYEVYPKIHGFLRDGDERSITYGL